MPFENRAEAAQLLSKRLEPYRDRHPLVLAIPRGAVPMGKIIAATLHADFDVVLVRKLGAPENPELAIGSIDETGAVYLDPDLRHLWSSSYLEAEKRAQLQVLKQRRALYGSARANVDAGGRLVIVVDDGLATGSTMIAALRAVRSHRPAKLVAAVAVAPVETVQRIRGEADEVVCLETPRVFVAIGLHFKDFSQVSDEEVVKILHDARQGRAPDAAAATSRP